MSSRLYAHIGTFRQLEILLALFETQSVTEAAESLHLTQPTVSMQLKKLADAIGLPLYQIIGKRLEFTDAGRKTVQYAREILDSCSRLDMELAELKGLKSGTLKLAVVTTAKYTIPHLLGPFCARSPEIDIKFTVGNREQILSRMENGLDDFYVFSHIPERDDINVSEFLLNPLVAVCNEQHELAKKQQVLLQDLSQFPFLRREKGSGTRHAIESFCASENVQLNVRMTIESNEAIKHCIMSGLGYSILSAHSLAFGESGGLKVLPVKELPIMAHWSFVWLKNKALSPIARAFLDYVLQEGQKSLNEELNLKNLGINIS